VVGVDEIAVVRQPAEREDGHDYDEHPHDLTQKTCSLRMLSVSPVLGMDIMMCVS
jgi:hypothetical protein